MRWLFPLGLVLLPLGAVAQETEAERTDRGTIVAFIEDNLSGEGRQVTLRGFAGALSSRATATQLTIADADGVWLTVNDIVLDWSRSALLSGQVSVNEFSAAEIILDRAPRSDTSVPSPEASGFALPQLPVSVDISRISSPRIVLGETLLGQSVEGSIDASLSLSGSDGAAALTLQRTDDGPEGRIVLDTAFTGQTGELTISLEAVEGAGGIATTLLDLPGAPSVDLSVKGAGPITDFAADLRLASDGRDRLAGTIALTGAEQGGIGFRGDLAGDLAPLFLPDYADFLGDELTLSVAGQRSPVGRIDLSDLSLRARSIALDGRLRLAPDGLPELIDVTGTLRDPLGADVLVPGFDAQLSLRQAGLTIGYDAATDESWRAVINAGGVTTPDARFDDLSLAGSGRILRNPRGRLFGGTLEASANGIALTDPDLAMALGTSATASTKIWWQEGSGTTRLGDLKLAAGPLDLTANARISGLSDGFRIAGTLQATTTDLSRLSGLADRPLSGSGTITASGDGSPLGGDFTLRAQIDGQDLTADLPEVDNLLRGASQVAVTLRRDATGTTLDDLSLQATSLAVTGSGSITSQSADLALQLRFDDLTRLGPAYGGAIAGDLRLTGPLTQGIARIEATLSADRLRLGIAQADGLLNGRSDLILAADLADNRLQVERLTLTTPGASAQAQGLLATTGSDLTASLRLADLSRLRPGFGGAVQAEARFTGSAQTGAIRLTADASQLRLGQPEADRILAGASQLTAALRVENGALRVDDFRLNSPQLTAQGTGRVTSTRRDIDLSARLANLGLLLPEFPGPVTLVGTASDQGNGYDLSISGTGPGQIDARIAGRIAPDLARADLTLRGSAQAGLANPFIGSRVLSGPLSLDLRLNGPLALSSLSGRVALTQGRLADPGLPFSLQDMAVSADLAAGRAQIAASAGFSTGGRLTANGGLGLAAPFAADIGVTLDSVVLRDPQLYETRADGALRLTGPLTGGALVSGRIVLPQSEIRIASTGLGGSGLIENLRHIGDTPPVRDTRRRAGLQPDAGTSATGGRTAGAATRLDVEIAAPNQFFLRGRGLDAELGGILRLFGTTDAIIPSGAFNLIRGRLDILGRRLTLSEAALQLEGDFDAALRIVASSTNDGVTSSVVIEGSANDPQVSFTSVPQLPQEEVLSQLLFGRRLESLSAFQALQLANAVATLAGRGGEGIVSRLRKGFGLDDLDVQTDAAGNAQLTAGKYLTEKIYSEIVVDQQGKSQINLNLDLTDNVTVKGRVGADGNTGVGIYFEKDY